MIESFPQRYVKSWQLAGSDLAVFLDSYFASWELVQKDVRFAVANHEPEVHEAEDEARRAGVTPLRLAAAVAFCEMALADGTLAAAERERYRDMVTLYLRVDPADADGLFELCRRVTAMPAGNPRMTAWLRAHADADERAELIDNLLDLACRDGHLHPRENDVVNRVAGEIGVRPERVLAQRQRVERRAASLEYGRAH